jgi:hypothetical protein
MVVIWSLWGRYRFLSFFHTFILAPQLPPSYKFKSFHYNKIPMSLGLLLCLIKMLLPQPILHLSNHLIPFTFQILKVIVILCVWLNFYPLNHIFPPHLILDVMFKKGTMIKIQSLKKTYDFKAMLGWIGYWVN